MSVTWTDMDDSINIRTEMSGFSRRVSVVSVTENGRTEGPGQGGGFQAIVDNLIKFETGTTGSGADHWGFVKVMPVRAVREVTEILRIDFIEDPCKWRFVQINMEIRPKLTGVSLTQIRSGAPFWQINFSHVEFVPVAIPADAVLDGVSFHEGKNTMYHLISGTRIQTFCEPISGFSTDMCRDAGTGIMTARTPFGFVSSTIHLGHP